MKRSIKAILNDHPLLHVWGHGTPRGVSVDLPTAREELLHPGTLQLIEAAACWCERHLEPDTPSRTRDATTYYWKHRLQNDTGLYVPSGAFAVAAALAGLPLNWDHYNPVLHVRESPLHPIGGRRD